VAKKRIVDIGGLEREKRKRKGNIRAKKGETTAKRTFCREFPSLESVS